MVDEYLLSHQDIGGVPCLMLAAPDVGSEQPLAVVVHGLGRHKEAMLPSLYAFARRGLRAVAVDSRLHGEQPGTLDRDVRLQTQYVMTMAEIIQGTAADITSLLDYFGGPPAAIHGVSMGGYVAFAAFADNPGLAAAAIAIGSPDWLEPLRAAGLGPGDPMYDIVAAQSPLERSVDVFPPRPLLMLHGDVDDVVTITGVRELERRLRPHYAAAPQDLELVIYAGLGHLYTDDMIERSADWIAAHLRGRAG